MLGRRLLDRLEIPLQLDNCPAREGTPAFAAAAFVAEDFAPHRHDRCSVCRHVAAVADDLHDPSCGERPARPNADLGKVGRRNLQYLGHWAVARSLGPVARGAVVLEDMLPRGKRVVVAGSCAGARRCDSEHCPSEEKHERVEWGLPIKSSHLVLFVGRSFATAAPRRNTRASPETNA